MIYRKMSMLRISHPKGPTKSLGISTSMRTRSCGARTTSALTSPPRFSMLNVPIWTGSTMRRSNKLVTAQEAH